MNAELDCDGQPLNRFFNAARVEGRVMSELLGVIRGILADDATNAAEAEYLDRWLKTNYEIACQWPANAIAQHLRQIFADGRVDEDERDSLHSLLGEIVGTQADYYASSTTALPLTKPIPEVIFDQNTFVLTGKFIYGTRKTCQREIEMRGGQCEENVTLRTRYLVIGSVGSRDWVQSSWGRKIEKAVEMSSYGHINIISEENWARYLMAV